MKLALGRIGYQEAASVAALAMSSSTIFSLEATRAYANGNSAYITAPLGVLFAFAIFTLIRLAIKKTGANELTELCDKALVPALGDAVALVVALFMAISAFELMMRFAAMFHTYIYPDVDFALIVFYTLLPVGVISAMGFECIGRMGKIFAVFLGVLFILELVSAYPGYEAYRLYPLPLGNIPDVLIQTLETIGRSSPALIALLVVYPALQGEKNLKVSALTAACAAALISAATELCLGMAYTYEELSNMYMPLYRLNMILIKEGYFFRLDKLSLFFWLISASVSASLYIYAGALAFTRRFTRFDVRPACCSLTATVALTMLLFHIKNGGVAENVMNAVRSYLWTTPALLVIVAVIALIGKKTRTQKCKG